MASVMAMALPLNYLEETVVTVSLGRMITDEDMESSLSRVPLDTAST